MAVVIGIAGAPGSGKSTVVRALAAALGDASVLHMDSYERMTRQTMEKLAEWAARGADLDELSMPLLADHLAALKAGHAVTDPSTGSAIQPARFIVFETQLGRAHAATGRHIDYLVWLDTPLDVALARTLRRLLGDALAAPAPELPARTAWLHGYLENYLALVRQLVVQQRERVLPGADLGIDGGAGLAALVDQLRTQLTARFEPSR
jgi:uridine kinase